jgi:hypothetical protein
MEECNRFAEKHGLRQFTDWSKVWEYPWLHAHGLEAAGRRDRHLVDLGSELSPLPLLLAARGASVTLIETDSQWVPVKEKVRAELHAPVR